jgi:hypothetical protein
VWDSTAALGLPCIPKSLLVFVGGYMGLELGSVSAASARAWRVEMTPGCCGDDRDPCFRLAKRVEKLFSACTGDALALLAQRPTGR